MKKGALILLSFMLLWGLLPKSLLNERVDAASDPSLIFRMENQDINGSPYPDLNDKVDTLKTLDQGTIVVKFRYTGNSIMSLFSLSNNTVADGHFHLYITPTLIGSENRYAEPGKTKSNTHIKSNAITLTPNVDHTVAMVMDKAAGYKYFLDGVLIKEDSVSPRKFLNNIYAPNSSKLGITERAGGAFQYPFTGSIAYAEVYSKPLDDQTLINMTRTVSSAADLNAVKQAITSNAGSSTFVFTGGGMTFSPGAAEGYRNYMQHFEERIRWELGGTLQRRNFVFNTQKKGITAGSLLADFDRRVTRLQPKAVFVSLGQEDAASNTPLATFKSNVKTIVSQIRNAGSIPVLESSIVPISSTFAAKVSTYVDTLKQIAAEDGVVFINHYETWNGYTDRAALTASDGVTPNELGHLRLAKELMSLFGVGGSGYTWGINGYTDTKEPASQVINRNVAYTESGSAISVNLTTSLTGLGTVEKVMVTLRSDEEQVVRETSSGTGTVSMGSVVSSKPYTLTVKAKMAGSAAWTQLQTAYIHGSAPAPVQVPSEIQSLLQGTGPVTWLFSGDSITHGALHTKGYKSFAELFGERVKGELSAVNPARADDIVLNTGVSSMTTRDLLANFDRWVTVNQPDVVFIAFGMNDSSNQMVPLEEFKNNLRTAVDKVRQLGAIPVLETINTIKPADGGRVNNLPLYVDAIRSVAQEKQELLVDHYQYWTEAEQKESHIKSIWLNDNIHPNYVGSTHMAAAIFHTLGLDDPNSYIASLRYIVAPATQALNQTPSVTAANQTITVDVPSIVTAAGGAGAVESVTASINLGNQNTMTMTTFKKDGVIRFTNLTQPGSYTVKVKVKVKGQNKELIMNDANASL